MVCVATFLTYRKSDVSVIIFASTHLCAMGQVTHPPLLIVSCIAPFYLVRIAQPCMLYTCMCIASLCDATAYDAW